MCTYRGVFENVHIAISTRMRYEVDLTKQPISIDCWMTSAISSLTLGNLYRQFISEAEHRAYFSRHHLLDCWNILH